MSNKLSLIIQAKSDQLNADDLLIESKTITITKVTLLDPTKPQPVIINYQNDNGRPYKPCKGMTVVICKMWGAKEDGRDWVGKSMTLFRNPEVIFSGEKVGGIEISHMSHLSNQIEDVSINVRKGKKRIVKIKRLEQQQQPIAQQEIEAYNQWAVGLVNGGILTNEEALSAYATQGGIFQTDQHKQAFLTVFSNELTKKQG